MQDGSTYRDNWTVPGYWTIDIIGKWLVSKNLTISANLINALDRLPPFRHKTENNINGADTRYGDYYGRQLQMKMEYKF